MGVVGAAAAASCFSLWWRQILLDLVEVSDGIDGDRCLGRRAYLMMVELAW